MIKNYIEFINEKFNYKKQNNMNIPDLMDVKSGDKIYFCWGDMAEVIIKKVEHKNHKLYLDCVDHIDGYPIDITIDYDDLYIVGDDKCGYSDFAYCDGKVHLDDGKVDDYNHVGVCLNRNIVGAFYNQNRYKGDIIGYFENCLKMVKK